MSTPKTLACVRCGAPIPSGFECAACAAPRLPPAEPARSDGPKLALASLLALLMVGVLVYGGISGSASIGREKAEAARREAAREARYAKEEADRKAAAARVAQAQSDAQADAAHQERGRKFAEDLAALKAEADAGLNVPPPSAPSPTSTAPTAATTAVQCALCHGTGVLTERCNKCNGDGEIECDHCETYNFRFNRGGDPNCPECHGVAHMVGARGSRAGGVAFVYTCPKCNGTKEITKTCPYCHGTGNTPS